MCHREVVSGMQLSTSCIAAVGVCREGSCKYYVALRHTAHADNQRLMLAAGQFAQMSAQQYAPINDIRSLAAP